MAPSPSPCGEERISSATPCAVGSPSRPASGHAPSAVAAAEPSPPFGWTAASLESLRRRGAVELSTNKSLDVNLLVPKGRPLTGGRKGILSASPACCSASARCRQPGARAARCPPDHSQHKPPAARPPTSYHGTFRRALEACSSGVFWLRAPTLAACVGSVCLTQDDIDQAHRGLVNA